MLTEREDRTRDGHIHGGVRPQLPFPVHRRAHEETGIPSHVSHLQRHMEGNASFGH